MSGDAMRLNGANRPPASPANRPASEKEMRRNRLTGTPVKATRSGFSLIALRIRPNGERVTT